jgi:hypothetical protein
MAFSAGSAGWPSLCGRRGSTRFFFPKLLLNRGNPLPGHSRPQHLTLEVPISSSGGNPPCPSVGDRRLPALRAFKNHFASSFLQSNLASPTDRFLACSKTVRIDDTQPWAGVSSAPVQVLRRGPERQRTCPQGMGFTHSSREAVSSAQRAWHGSPWTRSGRGTVRL